MAVTFLPRVILKFKDNVSLPYVDDVGPDIEQRGLGSWNALKAAFPTIRLVRLHRSNVIKQLAERAATRDSSYHRNILTYFIIECASAADADAIANTVAGWGSVETAYVDRIPALPQGCTTGFLSAAVGGIDAVGAGGLAGGRGQGQAIVDVELGWTLTHAALAAHAIPPPIFGIADPLSCSHGTSVLGIVCGYDAAARFEGIAPDVSSVRVASCQRDAMSLPAMSTVAEAIAFSAGVLAVGNVLLVEVQTPDFLPCETDVACFDSIRLATALGIAVVEAAGNGATDLDLYRAAGGLVLRRNDGSKTLPKDFRDSYAIMVAASSSSVPHTRRANSNFGSRIDCYAWGDSVFTAVSANSVDTTSYSPPCFVDTSAAAAIIAGAALVVQGLASAAGNPVLDAVQLRTVLSDPMHGTPAAPADAGVLGVMPDLHKIAAQFVRVPSTPTNVRVIG